MTKSFTSTRSVPRWLVAMTALLLAARIVVAVAPARHEPDLVKWRTPAEAVVEAQTSGRPVMYVFSAGWCPPCRQLDHGVLHDEKCAAFINEHFIPVHAMDRRSEDGHNAPEIDALMQRFKIESFPQIVIDAPGVEPRVMNGYGGKRPAMAFLQGKVRKHED